MRLKLPILIIVLALLLFACAVQPSSSGLEQPHAPPVTQGLSETPSPVSTEQIFFLTKMGMLTQEADTETAVSPKNSETVEAIMATKYAGATQMAGTMTAMPSLTPTPSIPSDSSLCKPADLKSSFSSMGGTGNLFLFVNLTNISDQPCYLQALPQAKLTDAQGNLLDVDYGYQGMSTDQADSALKNKVGLFPQWQAGFTLIWFDSRTWCGAPVTGDLIIHVTLMDNSGAVDVPTDMQLGHVCDVPGTRTSVSITEFDVRLPALYTPQQIKMFDEKSGWLIAGQGWNNLFHTNNGGSTWQDVTPEGVEDLGNNTFYLDSQNAWIMMSVPVTNNNSIIYRTADGGKSWQLYQNLPFKQASLDFVNPNIGFAKADYSPDQTTYSFTLWQTVDGGATWTQMKFAQRLGLPNVPNDAFLLNNDQQFGFQNESAFWFGGHQSTNPNNVYMQTSHDSGVTWTKSFLSIPAIVKGEGSPLVSYSLPVFITERDAYLVIGYTFPSAQDFSVLMFTHDDGNTWTASPSVLSGTEWSLHLLFITPSDGFGFCRALILCVTHDGGQTWQYIPSNMSVGALNGLPGISEIDFVTVDEGWAIYHDESSTKLLKTMNGGKTWLTPSP